MDTVVPMDESAFVKEFLIQLQTENHEYIADHNYDKKNQLTPKQLKEFVSTSFPEGRLVSTKILRYSFFIRNNITITTITIESTFDDGWSVSKISFRKNDGKFLVIGIHIERIDDSIRVAHQFTNVELTLPKLSALILTFAIPIFMIVTCIAVYRTPIKRKWHWYLLSFTGVTSTATNWTTGYIDMNFFTIQLLGFRGSAIAEYSPYIFAFTLPVGAIAFWFRRNKLIERSMVSMAVEQETN